LEVGRTEATAGKVTTEEGGLLAIACPKDHKRTRVGDNGLSRIFGRKLTEALGGQD